MPPTQLALLIEDDLDYARVLKERLSSIMHQAFEVHCAASLAEGLRALSARPADVVLLDLLLPDSKGLPTFEAVHAQAPETPVVVLTGFDNDAVALEAVRKGAQDYLVKGEIDVKVVGRVIRYAIERQRMQSALRSLSLVDELTGLYNRRGFLTLASQHLKLAQRTNRGSLVVFLDVDGLKQINDTFGHREGDLALIDAAELLRGTFRASDVVARIGGDEFAVIAIEAHKDSVELLGSRLEEKLRELNARAGRRYALALSFGTAYLDPHDVSSVEELMSRADRALYEHKRMKPRSV